jgi:hypothetical protein
MKQTVASRKHSVAVRLFASQPMRHAPERLGPSFRLLSLTISVGTASMRSLLYGLTSSAGMRCFSPGLSTLGREVFSDTETMDELYAERRGRRVPDVTTKYTLSAAGVPTREEVYMSCFSPSE